MAVHTLHHRESPTVPFTARAAIKVEGFDREIPVGETVAEVRSRIDEAGPDGFLVLSREGHPETWWRARTITFLRPEPGFETRAAGA